jgi:hypothetical protein
MNPRTQNSSGWTNRLEPDREANQLKILIPVGTAITMVAAVK